MWISKKRLEQLEKRIADLEGQVQSRQDLTFNPATDAELLKGVIERFRYCKANRDNVPKHE